MIQKYNHTPVCSKLRLLVVIGISILFSIQRIQAQTADVTLNTPITNSQQITATHSIALNPGFGANGANGIVGLKIVAPNLFSCGVLGVPSSTQNYVQTLTPRQPFTDASLLTSQTTCVVNQSIQYIDGLGRLLQAVQVNANPSGTKDEIQAVAYDQFGRESTKYLPYTTNSGTAGSYRSDALTAGAGVFNFYNPTGTGSSGSQQSNGIVIIPIPSTTTAFEPSSLNRPLEQGAPGDAWQLTGTTVTTPGTTSGHTVKVDYGDNDAASLSSGTGYWAKQYGVTIDATTGIRSLVDEGSYATNVLYLTITKDENWTSGKLGTTEEYKDKDGHIVLKRTFNYNTATSANEILSTYYVYDDYNNLAFVLPPGANPDGGLNSISNQTTLNNLCYQYNYDERQRLIQKRIPGKDWEYIVYNSLDQPVLTQDGNQRLNNQWTVTKYDAQGRVIMSGLWNAGSVINQVTLQASIYAGAQFDTRDYTNTTTGYNITSYPALNTILSITYYDDYNIPNLPAAFVNTANSTMTKGLPTASKMAVLNNPSDMLWSVNYYDDKGRTTQTYKQHYLGGSVNVGNYDVINNTYDFTNQVTATTRQHYNATGTTPVLTTIANTYVYDHMGRKRQTWEQINGSTNVVISQTDYNEVGQLVTKHLHSEDNGSDFLQNVSYAYNERGWLRTSGTSLNTTPTNLFNLELKYDNAPAPQYNGNIGQMSYLTTQVANPGSRTFNYTYDALNRLTLAAFTGGQTGDALDETINYDVMGNITQLVRNGTGAGTLNYTNYTGNQLNTVTGYSARSYAYDPNGNATSDGMGKGITYNLLNLPQTVSSGATTLATYTYDAGGDKLRNTGSDGSCDYISGIVYHNGAIAFINTEEGRAALNSGVYNYEYNLKDHLGNNRVSIDQYNGAARVIQEDEYYSFGLRKPTGGYDLSNNNRYLYNGKEIQTDLANQYDYGARFYDPVIGRWTSVDPLAEKSRRWNPYNYVMDNPLKFIDPDGMAADSANNKPQKQQIGSYTVTFENGKTYSGKGSMQRAKASAKRVGDANDTKVAKDGVDWASAENDRQAFKDEDDRINDNGGVGSDDNYNKIKSPGAKYNEEDSKKAEAEKKKAGSEEPNASSIPASNSVPSRNGLNPFVKKVVVPVGAGITIGTIITYIWPIVLL